MQDDIVDRIEREIRSRYAEGIDLSPETEQFIEATFGEGSVREVCGRLADKEAGAEVEVVIDLLFSPEEGLQRRIEALLAPEGLSLEQFGALADRLRQTPLRTRLRTDDRSTVALFLPGEMAAGFLDRFNLARPVDEALAGEAVGRYDRSEALKMRSRLREARFCQEGPAKETLLRFFAAASPARRDFWDLFDYLVGFLRFTAGGSDLYAGLTDRKNSCLRHLRQAADLDRTMQRHNIETLMIGGTRLPHVDSGALAGEIACIDELCVLLFGRPAPAPAGTTPFDLGEVCDRDDLARMIRFFSGS